MAGLQGVVEPLQPALHVGKLGLDCLQPTGELPSHGIHLLGHQGHKLGDGLIGQDALLDLPHHVILHPWGIEVAGLTGSGAVSLEGATDIVGKPAALGPLADIGPPTLTTSQQPAQEELAAHPGRPLHRRGPLM